MLCENGSIHVGFGFNNREFLDVHRVKGNYGFGVSESLFLQRLIVQLEYCSREMRLRTFKKIKTKVVLIVY